MDSLITIRDGIAVLDAETASRIAEFERSIKSIKEQEESLRQAILEAMEASGVIKLETDDLTINYIEETYKETFNSKGFRKDHPEMYDDYVKMSPVKSSVRIKVK